MQVGYYFHWHGWAESRMIGASLYVVKKGRVSLGQHAAGARHIYHQPRGYFPIALDTEADSLHHYRESVCLIQVTHDSRHFLIDPLGKFPLDELWPPTSRHTWILHGADFDLRMLRRAGGARTASRLRHDAGRANPRAEGLRLRRAGREVLPASRSTRAARKPTGRAARCRLR